MTFFGFMHGEAVGIAVSPTLAIAYALVGVFLFALSRYPSLAPALTAPHISDDAIAHATPAE
jgi:adenine/guanine/hypoxanthine permease